MLRNETTRLEKFMHEHKLKWFSVSSNIILRRHEGFIEGGNSAEILHFVRKVERQTFIQIWTSLFKGLHI